MAIFIIILALVLSLLAFIKVPSWMEKKGLGKDKRFRKRCGIGLAISLFLILIPLASSFIDETEMTTTETPVEKEEVEQSEPINPTFEQVAYYKRDKKGDFNYRIFVFITNASARQMEKHARNQMWSKSGTTMVCYFRNIEDIDADAVTLAKSVDDAIEQIWKPSLVARYMHWPTGKEEFTESPYSE